MPRRPIVRHLLLWFAAAAMVLRAAMPLLATASASLQGVPLAEVCSVYGVATRVVTAAVGDEQPASHGTSVHLGSDCAIAVLAALHAPPAQLDSLLVGPSGNVDAAAGMAGVAVPDASARWLANLLHAPPLAG